MSDAPVKPHLEFFGIDADAGWQAIADHPEGVTQLVLADNIDAHQRTGSRTRLVRWQPGTLLPDPVVHDYREEILVLSGDLVAGCAPDGTGGESFGAYSFATRPAGAGHGPFTTRTGCLMLELDIYE